MEFQSIKSYRKFRRRKFSFFDFVELVEVKSQIVVMSGTDFHPHCYGRLAEGSKFWVFEKLEVCGLMIF